MMMDNERGEFVSADETATISEVDYGSGDGAERQNANKSPAGTTAEICLHPVCACMPVRGDESQCQCTYSNLTCEMTADSCSCRYANHDCPPVSCTAVAGRSQSTGTGPVAPSAGLVCIGDMSQFKCLRFDIICPKIQCRSTHGPGQRTELPPFSIQFICVDGCSLGSV